MSRMLRSVLFCFLLLVPLLSPAVPEEEVPPDRRVPTVRVAGAINPVVAQFIADEIERANAIGARAFLIELDTPGGLDTSMRWIIQEVLGSRVPVIVFVFPPGSRAASAGALITLAADFAVMAPGTNLGAAHPVSVGPGGGGETEGESVTMKKVVQDAVAYARSIAAERGRNEEWAESIVRESVSTPAAEALKANVIDLIAEDEAELLRKLDGRTYMDRGEERTLRTEGAVIVLREMNWRKKILNTISNPTVAYLLMMLGILGIFFEISQPGVVLPGAIGAIALLLAFFGLQTLPVNYAGVLLILLGVILFILEIKIVSYGMLSIGGIVSMALGSMMLIDTSEPYLQISRAVIAATVAFCSAFFLLVLFFVVRTQRSRYVSGREGMVGERGTAVSSVGERGRVFVHGEYWDAWSREPIAEGDSIEVVEMGDGLRLEVRRAPHTDALPEAKK